MTEFEKRRLAYFQRAAKNSEWIRLGPGDVSFLSSFVSESELIAMKDQFAIYSLKLLEDFAKAESRIKELQEDLKYAYERIDKAGV